MIAPASRAARLVLPALILLAAASPAHAEKLVFDHRTYPALKAVLDSGDEAMIAFDGRNPRYVTDVIAIRGKSASDWSEALEIVSRVPAKGMATAQDWAAELKAKSDRLCPNTVTPLAEDAASLTFERRAPGCRAEPETALARVVAGKRSLFLLRFLVRGVPDAATRAAWLALLASAYVE